MASKGQLVVRFAGDTRDLDRSTARASKIVSRHAKATAKASKLIGSVGRGLAVAGGAAAVAVGALAVQTTKDLMRVERLGKQTEAVIKATGGAAGRTGSQVAALAGRLEKMSGAEAETVTEGQNMLLTFKNIKGKQFDAATKSMLDMGVAMNKGSLKGLDLKDTSILMGKALNDPIKGLTALTRVGVTFSDKQKSQIKRMQEAGNVAGAQGVILKELQSQFGGAAKAAGKSTEGMMAKLENSFGDIAEKTLSFVLPALQKLMAWVNDKVMPALARFGDWLRSDGAVHLQKFGSTLKAIGGFIMNNVVPPLADMGKWFVKNRDTIAAVAVAVAAFAATMKIAAIIGTVSKAIKAFSLANVVATVNQWRLNAAVLANPYVAIGAAIVAFVAGLVFFFTKTKTGQKIVSVAWGAIKKAIKGVTTWWTKTAWPAIKSALKAMGAWFKSVGRAVGRVWRAMGDGIGRVWRWIKRNVIDRFVLGLKVLRLAFQLARDRVSGSFGRMRDRLARIGQWIREKVFGRMRDGLGRMRDGFRNAKDGIGRIWEGLRKLAARPINFVLGTVYNKGIRRWVGKIFDFFGKANPLPEAKLVKFAKGSEDHRAQIARAGAMRLWAEPETGGEAYIPLAGSKRPRSTAILAKVASRFGYGLQKYADGGFSFGLRDALKFAGDTGGWLKDKLSGFAAAKFGAGRTGGIWDMLREIPGTIIRNMGGWAKSQLGSLFGGMFGGGKYNGKAAAGMGWRAMWDAVRGAFPSASLNSAFRPGAITAVGTPSFHGLGRAIDVTPSMKIFDWLAKNFPFSTELIYSPAGARQLYKGRRTLFGEPTRGDHWDHIHWAMKNGGMLNKVPKFDNGGTLSPGFNTVYNGLGRPEPLRRADEGPVQRISLEGELGDAIVKIIRRKVKSDGGNVQLVLGRNRVGTRAAR